MEEGDSSISEDGGGVTFEVEDGAHQLVVNEETGEMEVIDLGDPLISQEIEVVTVEATGSSGIYSTGRKLSTSAGSTITVSQNPQNPVHRVKSAPALLRNSRRVQPADQLLGGVVLNSESKLVGRHLNQGASHLPPVSANYLTKSGRQIPSTSQQFSTSTISSSSGFNHNQGVNEGLQHAIVLDENGQETHEYVILAPNDSGEYSIVDRGTRDVTEQQEYFHTPVDEKIDTSVSFQHQGQTIIICQDPDSNQINHLIEDVDGNLVIDGSMTYEMEDTTLFSLDGADVSVFDGSGGITISPLRVSKPKKKAKKPLQVMIGSDGTPLKKKGQTELKCMEKACIMTCFNVSELRKHLHVSHLMQFDEETLTFLTEDEFKKWRENYERERMVSFIYRGGTKKIAKDQAVTYMICHRSGHYKPTMSDNTQRKRKMKPQGSCKMGGYCTAGIKLLKNLDSGNIKMDICHTHYGHPLDSDAIPHLRVNPTLRKIILGKFQEGLSFTEVLAYIHHNPDRLEGLRLVDRRAVRNIFDTWKNPTRRSKKAQKDFEEFSLLVDPIMVTSNELDEDPLINSESVRKDGEEEIPSTLNKISNIQTPESSVENLISQDLPLLQIATETNEKYDEETNEDLGPPKLVRVNQLSKKKYLKQAKPQLENDDTNEGEDSDASACSEAEVPLLIVKNEPGVPISVNRGNYRLRPNRKVEVYRSASSSKLKKSQISASDCEQEAETKSKSVKSKSTDSENPKLIDIKKIKKEKDAEELELELPLISETLEKSIEKLHNHGESGPTVLLYKPVGKLSAKYGDAKRDLRKDDFCVVLQSPVQRQLMQMFPNIIGFEILDGPKSSQSQLKLAFLIVLDEYREAIPVAWLVANSVEPRIVGNFFKAIRTECGELQSKYFMTPRNSEAYRLWCSTFTEKPKCIQNDVEVRRDLKNLVWQQFGTDKGRREVWYLMESFINERNKEAFIKLLDQLDPLLEKLSHAGIFRKKFDKDWIGKAEEWALCNRIRAPVNVIGVSHSFGKLKKFVSFKGTKNLNESFDHILKIGYDKCFLRSKRMFKGDQKYSQFIDEINTRHKRSRKLPNRSILSADEETSVISVSEDKTCEVFSVGSPCDCRLVCKYCNICVHVYLCTCSEYVASQMMCEHIHLAHCQRMSITEDEPELITGDLNMNSDEGGGVFGEIETNGTEENPGAIINIGAVLKAAGLFHRSDGLQPDQIVSITDADTQRILYENVPTVDLEPGDLQDSQTKPESTVEIDKSSTEAPNELADLTETEIAVQSLNTSSTVVDLGMRSEEISTTVVAISDIPSTGGLSAEICLETVDNIEVPSESVEILATDVDGINSPLIENDPIIEQNVSDTLIQTVRVRPDPETATVENLIAEPEQIPAAKKLSLETSPTDELSASESKQEKTSTKAVKEICSKPEPKSVRRSNRVPKPDRVKVIKRTKNHKTVEVEPEPPKKRMRSDIESTGRRTSLRRKK